MVAELKNASKREHSLARDKTLRKFFSANFEENEFIGQLEQFSNNKFKYITISCSYRMANCLFLISLVPETLFLCYTDAQTDDNEPPRGQKRELVITACRLKLRIAMEENP